MSGGARVGCDHDWIVIVPDPNDVPDRGLQQCIRCLLEVARIHPVPVNDDLADEQFLADVFGPIARGVVRRRACERPDLTPTFLEPS